MYERQPSTANETGTTARRERGIAAPLDIAVVCLILLGVELILVESGTLYGQDRSAELAAHSALGTSTFGFFDGVSTAAGGVGRTVAVLIIVSLLALQRYRWSVVIVAATVAGSALVNAIIKDIVRRPRPHLFPGAEHASGYSFPSGHAMDSIVFFSTLVFVLWHVTRRKRVTVIAGLLATALTALVGLARVVLGVHYPSDVVGGYLAGAACVALAVSALHRPLEREYGERSERAGSRRYPSGPAF